MKILVVDDEPELVRALGIRLSSEGYEVLTAHDGAQATTRIHKDHPDLVLLDIHLPAGSGLKVCERLRGNPTTSKTPVIAITADPSPKMEQRCSELGCFAFFRKPYRSPHLMEAISRALSSSRARDPRPIREGPSSPASSPR